MSSAKCVLLLLCYHLLLGGVVSEFSPTVYPAKIFSSSQCGQYNPYIEQLREVLQQIEQKKPKNNTCKSILDNCPSAPSGYYNITTTNGSTTQVYCDMEGTNCGGEGGWTRVAYINMTQPNATCPEGLEQKNHDDKMFCGTNGYGCNSTMFPTLVEYSKVCGQVRGYQDYGAVAFYFYNTNTDVTIDDVYVVGVSITYGNTPRTHIWTYASGSEDVAQYNCPCKQNSTTVTPPYVGTDYYCESGTPLCCLMSNDPLWDGQQCGGGEAPCCKHPNMPWFIKTLNETTTEDIELRVCGFMRYDDTPLELIEMFVQ